MRWSPSGRAGIEDRRHLPAPTPREREQAQGPVWAHEPPVMQPPPQPMGPPMPVDWVPPDTTTPMALPEPDPVQGLEQRKQQLAQRIAIDQAALKELETRLNAVKKKTAPKR